MSEKKRSSKSDTIYKISTSIFQLEASKGHLQWKVTDLVRKADISRPLIYRYFGSSKKEMLQGALRSFVEVFYAFGPESKGLSFIEILKKSRLRIENCPEATLFYTYWRFKDSWIQEEFIGIEEKFLGKLRTYFPDKDEQSLLRLYVFLHGLVTAPFIRLEDHEELFDHLELPR